MTDALSSLTPKSSAVTLQPNFCVGPDNAETGQLPIQEFSMSGFPTSKFARLGWRSFIFIYVITWTMAERLRSFVRMRPVAPYARSRER